jgi:hypothetical protein
MAKNAKPKPASPGELVKPSWKSDVGSMGEEPNRINAGVLPEPLKATQNNDLAGRGPFLLPQRASRGSRSAKDEGTIQFEPESAPPRPGVALGIFSDEHLCEKYLPKPMEQYFLKKFPDLDRTELLVGIAELLKGLILMDSSNGTILFSGYIDEIWHHWILQTEQYTELCSKFSDGRFRHHSSADYPLAEGETGDNRVEFNRRVAFFASYVCHFGAMEAGRLRYWPALELLMSVLEWDLSRTNAYLHDKGKRLARHT